MQLVSAYDLYKLEEADELLETGIQSLDALLGGGISPGTFLEIVGLSATGKSQLCMQLAVTIQKNEIKRDSVYVDTEGGFHTKRICDIATSVLTTVEPLEILKHIQVARCHDLIELTSTIHRLELLVQQNSKIGLIIVDSIAMPLRGENDYALRSKLEISQLLSKLAASYRLIVIVVNHVTYRFESERGGQAHLASALGISWSHRPNTRLWLCPPDTNSRNSSILLVKSPSTKSGSVLFKITEGGLMEIKENFVI